MLYALIVGMTVPLKVGILEVSPSQADAGTKLSLEVKAYNSNFDKATNRAWLKLDSVHTLESIGINVVDARNLVLTFQLPEHLPVLKNGVANLIVTNEKDGPAVFPSAIFIKPLDSNNMQLGSSIWSGAKLTGTNYREGFLFPYRNILVETIRNIYYHVSLWFAMFILFFTSMITAILYIIKKDSKYDHLSSSFATAGMLFGILGTLTGMIWAKHTWGAYWTTDVKLNMTAVSLLIYMAYFILRSSIQDTDRQRVVSSAFNIFAFAAIIPLIFVIPRLTDSLHPGNGGNPALGGEDLDNKMRMVFYPAVIGFTLIGVWLSQIYFRFKRLEEKQLEKDL